MPQVCQRSEEFDTIKSRDGNTSSTRATLRITFYTLTWSTKSIPKLCKCVEQTEGVVAVKVKYVYSSSRSQVGSIEQCLTACLSVFLSVYLFVGLSVCPHQLSAIRKARQTDKIRHEGCCIFRTDHQIYFKFWVPHPPSLQSNLFFKQPILLVNKKRQNFQA